MIRILVCGVFCCLVVFSISCEGNKTGSVQILSKAVSWLWRQQSEDGGWHSNTHAVLRDGKVLTPYILYYLMNVPEDIYTAPTDQMEKAVAFITSGLHSSVDSSKLALTDYPNYSAAYSLRILHKLQRETELQHMLGRYLAGQQFTEERGFHNDSLVYGGWGYGEKLGYGEHGHVDISHTRRILESLQACGLLTQDIIEKAMLFIMGVQRHHSDDRLYDGCISRKELPFDGGFIASTVTLSTNKSKPVLITSGGIHYPSYATATCDGLMALHAMMKDSSEQYLMAKEWLKKHNSLKHVEGLAPDDPEQWSDIMHFYHLAVRSETMKLVDDHDLKKQIEKILSREQLPDGSFINPIGGVNKEDDPLMATIFGIQALSNCAKIAGFQ